MKLHHTLPILLTVAAAAMPATALAGFSGLSVGEQGGQSASAASEGVEGLALNPALAGFIHGGETYLDLGFMVMSPTYTRSGQAAGGEPHGSVTYSRLAPIPAVGVAGRPVQWAGLGLSVSAPFGRGAEWPDDGAQRYHLQSVEYHSIFVTPSVAFRPIPFLSIGGGPSVVYTTESLRQRTDLGTTIHQLDPAADAKPPIEDPFLEGQLEVKGATGINFGYTAGIMAQPHRAFTLGVSYHSPVDVAVRGRSVLTPSLDLAVESHADFTMEFTLPPTVNVGARWEPTAKLTVGADFQWLGYSTIDQFKITFANSELRGSNAELDVLLLTLGSDMGEALDNTKLVAREAEDTWNARVHVASALADVWTVRGLAGYDRRAIPDHTVNAGNLDFDLLYFGAGIERRINGHWTVYVTSTQYFPQARSIRNSELDPYAPAETGRGYLPGNGDYSLFLHRSSVGVKFHWGGGDRSAQQRHGPVDRL